MSQGSGGNGQAEKIGSGNAFIRRFLLARNRLQRVLTGNQWKALDNYNSFADADGVMYPGMKKIAELIGTTDRHARQLTRELVDLGLIENIDAGRGAGRSAMRRIIITEHSVKAVENRLKTGLFAAKKNRPKKDKKQAKKQHRNRPETCKKIGQKHARIYKDESSIELPVGTTNNNNGNGDAKEHVVSAPNADVVVGRGESEEEKQKRIAEVKEALDHAGILLTKKHPLNSLLETGLTASIVRTLEMNVMFKRARNQAGLLVNLLLERAPEMIQKGEAEEPDFQFDRHGNREYKDDLPVRAKRLNGKSPVENERVLGTPEERPTFNISPKDEAILQRINDHELCWHIREVQDHLPAQGNYQAYARVDIEPRDVREGRYQGLLPLITQHIISEMAPEKLRKCGEYYNHWPRGLPEVPLDPEIDLERTKWPEGARVPVERKE